MKVKVKLSLTTVGGLLQFLFSDWSVRTKVSRKLLDGCQEVVKRIEAIEYCFTNTTASPN